MVLNADKCHFMCLGTDAGNETIIFNNSYEEKILGITIDNKLHFKSLIKIVFKKVTHKIRVLSRLINHLNDCQQRIIFNYCSIIIITVLSYCSLLSSEVNTKRP